MKKLVSFLATLSLALGLFGLIPTQSFADEVSTTSSGMIDLNNLEELQKTGDVTVKQITYEEMIEKIADNEGISVEQAREQNPDINKTNSRIGTQATLAASAPLEINVRQNVTSTYKPTLQVFVWTYASGSFHELQKIQSVALNRGYNGISKQYKGIIQCEITNGKQNLWWYINGDFYNNGTTTVTGKVTADGLIWKGEGSISGASSHYKYWNKSGVY